MKSIGIDITLNGATIVEVSSDRSGYEVTKGDYIHLNPITHGFVSAPREWPHSSFAKWIALGVYEPNWGSGEKPELPEWAKESE